MCWVAGIPASAISSAASNSSYNSSSMSLRLNTPVMLLPVRCKLLRKRPSQFRAATSEAIALLVSAAAGVFRLKILNMVAGFYNALCVQQRTLYDRSFYETPKF